jgi:osomolarity two-component system sensor histidine kinase SLN1
MDNIMDNMNGVDATRIIRQLGFSGVIIGLTGNVLKSDIDAFLAAGADHVFPKPFERETLADLLQVLANKGRD